MNGTMILILGGIFGYAISQVNYSLGISFWIACVAVGAFHIFNAERKEKTNGEEGR